MAWGHEFQPMYEPTQKGAVCRYSTGCREPARYWLKSYFHTVRKDRVSHRLVAICEGCAVKAAATHEIDLPIAPAGKHPHQDRVEKIRKGETG